MSKQKPKAPRYENQDICDSRTFSLHPISRKIRKFSLTFHIKRDIQREALSSEIWSGVTLEPEYEP